MNNILPKKALRSLNTYRPAVAEKKTKDVVRLSVNEGALGPSPNAIKAIKEWSLENHLFHRYPDQIDQGLINAIANRYQLIQENIVLGNGSDDLIQLVCNAFLDPVSVKTHPTFSIFEIFFAVSFIDPTGIHSTTKSESLTVSSIFVKILSGSIIFFNFSLTSILES